MDVAETPSLRHLLVRMAVTLLALVLLYVLGAGPAVYMAVKFPRSEPLLSQIYRPLDEAMLNTPLWSAFHAYENWWTEFAGLIRMK